MTTLEILNFMGRRGLRYHKNSLDSLISYIQCMRHENRIIIIESDFSPIAVCFFSICSNYVPYYVKETWDFLTHDPFGKKVYVEKIVSDAWDKTMRNEIERKLIAAYPQLEEAIWHRWDRIGDRKVIARRRIYARNSNQDTL